MLYLHIHIDEHQLSCQGIFRVLSQLAVVWLSAALELANGYNAHGLTPQLAVPPQ